MTTTGMFFEEATVMYCKDICN